MNYKSIMKIFRSTLLVGLLVSLSSIYNLSFQDINGNSYSMNQCQGKKILLVNIATGSSRVNQLTELQQLYQAHHDSLIIIAFPSNSFGKEHRSNVAIKNFCENQYGVTFPIASKNPVTGPGIQPVYNWLTSLAENQMIGEPVKGDFQKFLVDKNGLLIGVFAPSVSPLSNEIVEAITN
jgi:glutathione peroxidase